MLLNIGGYTMQKQVMIFLFLLLGHAGILLAQDASRLNRVFELLERRNRSVFGMGIDSVWVLIAYLVGLLVLYSQSAAGQ